MIGKIIKHNNGLVITITPALAKKLKLAEGDQCTLSTDGKNLIVEPIEQKTKLSKEENTKQDNKKIIEQAYKKVIKQYAPALKKLAKYEKLNDN